MSIAKFILPASIAFVLAACGSNPAVTASKSDHAHSHHAAHKHDHADAQHARRFSCQNGLSVAVRSINTDSVELRLDDKRAVLNAARAASGERYVANTGFFGSGAEWHQKGKSGMLTFKDPYGNLVETSCDAM